MRLPYFPLHQVLFPHFPLPLHVFEERYRQLVRDVVADGSPSGGRFLVSMITAGREAGGDAATQPIGTICEVHTAEHFPDGRWLLLAVGVARARLGAIDRSGPYPLVDAHVLPERDGEGATSALSAVQQALDAYLEAVKQFVAATASGGYDPREPRDVTTTLNQVLKPIRLPDDPSAASYAVAGVLQVALARKQQLLELPDASTRLRAELALLRREVRFLEADPMLEKAAEALRNQHTWGDLTDDQYRAERRDIEAALAALPARSTDTLVAFDEARARLLSMPEALAAASDEPRAEIAAVLIGRVEANRTTGMTGLEWTAQAAPFFRLVLSERAVWADGPRSRHSAKEDDPLRWYAA